MRIRVVDSPTNLAVNSYMQFLLILAWSISLTQKHSERRLWFEVKICGISGDVRENFDVVL